MNRGDSEVDGDEIDRGSFLGHPICDLCGEQVYGNCELYSHLSVEHYTCRFCVRKDPGISECHKNMKIWEATISPLPFRHFRTYHFLCEEEACLADEFVVFISEIDFM
ncbi:unnamed protein product, partial [Dovyalis caffra]